MSGFSFGSAIFWVGQCGGLRRKINHEGAENLWTELTELFRIKKRRMTFLKFG
jgi:hypothetical protein